MKLELFKVCKTFAQHSVLEEVTLNVTFDHVLAILGPSGGGKTTLLRIIAGLEYPDSGRVVIDGEVVDYREEALLRYRRRLGIVFQAYNLFPHLSALANVCLPLEKAHGVKRKEAIRLAFEALERLRLADHADKKPAQLSGGQRQRVAIARALVVQPKFLLLDEPTSALDPEMTAEVLDVIAELGREGRKLLLVTHQMGFARRIASRVAFVAEGKLAESAAAEDFFRNPQTEIATRFLEKILKY